MRFIFVGTFGAKIMLRFMATREGFALPKTLPALNNLLYAGRNSLDIADYFCAHLAVL